MSTPVDELRAAAEALRMNPKSLSEADHDVAPLLADWLDDAAANRRGLANDAAALAIARAITGSTS